MPGLCDLSGRLSSLHIQILVLYVCYIRRPCHTYQCWLVKKLYLYHNQYIIEQLNWTSCFNRDEKSQKYHKFEEINAIKMVMNSIQTSFHHIWHTKFNHQKGQFHDICIIALCTVLMHSSKAMMLLTPLFFAALEGRVPDMESRKLQWIGVRKTRGQSYMDTGYNGLQHVS